MNSAAPDLKLSQLIAQLSIAQDTAAELADMTSTDANKDVMDKNLAAMIHKAMWCAEYILTTLRMEFPNIG